MSTLRLYFLGTPGIRYDDQELLKPPTLKSQSLLAYLILHRHWPQPRDRLVGLFWGDRPEDKARRSLSTALWHIRRCLPDERLILSDPHTVQFDPQADLWLDVEEFQVLSSSVSGSHDLKPETVELETERLQRAVALYRGDFLDGFYDDWIINERYRLETLFGEALVRLMVGQEAKGEYAAALATALRLLDKDPLREDAHRLAMRAYYRLGQRNAALAQYRRCQEIVLEELGAEPMAETTELYRVILERRFEVERVPGVFPVEVPAVAPVGRSPLDVMVPVKLVGREQEMAFLHGCWQGAQAGHGGLVLIGGEAGVGKTRLAEEFANRLRWQGVRVLWGRCYEFERLLPYQPFAEALRAVLPALTSAELAAFPAWTVAEVARLVPEVSEVQPGLEKAPFTGSDQERARLFDGIARFLAELSSHGALLIVLEDLHWASESTLQLLHYLARHLADHPILTVGTFRPEAIGPEHPLLALRRRLTREGLVKPLYLPRLSPADVEALVAEMSGAGDVIVALARRLYRETEGNPFFLMEMVKALFEVGLIHLEGGAWRGDFASISAGTLPLPAGLSEAVQARVRRLDEQTQEALGLAAVLGREFDFDLLNAVWGRGEEATLEVLDDLLRRRLIDEGTGATARDYAFTHHKIQEVIYARMPRRHRQHAHARVGAAMETLYGPEAEAMAGELAFHFEQGRQLDKTLTEKAINYLRQAGDRAVRLSANEEAIAHFTKGLALLETLPDTPERASQELVLQISLYAPLRVVKGFAAPEVGRACARAWELCKQVGETPQLFLVLWQLGTFYSLRAEYQTALELCDQMFSLAERAEDPVLVALAHWGLGYDLVRLGELAPGLAHLEHVIAFYDPQQHHALTFIYGSDPGVACLSWASWALWFLGYPDQALKRSQEVLALAQELSHPHSLAFAQGIAGLLHQFRREAQAAQAWAEATITLSTEHGFPFWLAIMTFLHGWALAERGQAEEGISQMREGITAYLALGTEDMRSMMLALLAEAYGRVGQVEEGSSALAEALALVEKTGERVYEAEIHRLKGELLVMQGDEAEAETSFHRAIEVARQQRAKSWELRAAMSLSRLWQKQDKREEARQLLAEIYSWFTEGFDTPDLREAKSLLEELW